MVRPNKLRVITLGDGPRSEFYYDGKTVMAYAPAENLVAIAEAPPHNRRYLGGSRPRRGDLFSIQRRDRHRSVQGSCRRAKGRVFTSVNLLWSAEPPPTLSRTSTTMCSCRYGSVPKTSCLGCSAPCSETIRRGYGTSWISRTGRSTLRSGLTLSSSSQAAAAKRIAFARPDPWLQQGMKRPPRAKHSKTP